MMKKSGLSDVKVVGRSKRYAAPGTRYICLSYTTQNVQDSYTTIRPGTTVSCPVFTRAG